MIVAVTPNPALDLTWRVDRIIPGGVHRADTGRARAGGKGLNVARIAHAQGSTVLAVTTAGGAAGGEFSLELDRSGVPARLVPVAADTRRSIALVDEHLGDTTIVNERGENPDAAEWAALYEAVASAAASATVLVIAGSMPPGAPDDALPMLIATGRDAGACVIADTSGPALLTAASAGAHVLKPNADELRDATGMADPVAGAHSLIDLGAHLVLVSQGADGMLAVTADMVLHARLGRSLAGNPTGAGDAAVAAVSVLLDAGTCDTATILRRATAWSAAAVLMPLAGDIHDSWPALERELALTDLTDQHSPTAQHSPAARHSPTAQKDLR